MRAVGTGFWASGQGCDPGALARGQRGNPATQGELAEGPAPAPGSWQWSRVTEVDSCCRPFNRE